jgi:hypothetical protein
MNSNLYKIEDNNSISCLQESCSYRFRSPKNRHNSIMHHYKRCHNGIFKLLKIHNAKPYKKPLFQETKHITNQNFYLSNSFDDKKEIEHNCQQINTITIPNINSEFSVYYFGNDNEKYIFKFFKELNFIKLFIFFHDSIIKINDLDEFSFIFVGKDYSFIVDKKFNYFLFTNNIRGLKIFYNNNTVFESDFVNVFK